MSSMAHPPDLSCPTPGDFLSLVSSAEAEVATKQKGSTEDANRPPPSSNGLSGSAPTGPGMGPAGAIPALDKVGILGHVVWLMSQSGLHKHLFLSDLEWLVMPALSLGQFRIWHQTNPQGHNVPVAFASWAYLDEGAEARIKEGIKKLAPTDWKSGEALWLIDLIAPFGGADNVIKELREKVFEGRTVKSLQPAPDGKGLAVVEW